MNKADNRFSLPHLLHDIVTHEVISYIHIQEMSNWDVLPRRFNAKLNELKQQKSTLTCRLQDSEFQTLGTMLRAGQLAQVKRPVLVDRLHITTSMRTPACYV